ncbi:MAG: hypothetical protein JW881_00405 [Spirochaetales bacterium]|nr:hypothetical protein [Spirochaetales bacterium]
MKKPICHTLVILVALLSVVAGCVGHQHEAAVTAVPPVRDVRPEATTVSVEVTGREDIAAESAPDIAADRETAGSGAGGGPLLTKEAVAVWVDAHVTEYFQQATLSCEPAMIRLICGIWGIHDLGEEEVTALMPKHPDDPERGFVMEDISGSVYHPDGTPNWANYGAHAPVVLDTLSRILSEKGLEDMYRVEEVALTDSELRAFIAEEEDCLGAVIWVAAFIDGEKPPANDRGQVLGEHVQFVSPQTDSRGRLLVYDVWPWENQPFHLFTPFNRDMFDYRTIVIMKKEKESGR